MYHPPYIHIVAANFYLVPQLPWCIWSIKQPHISYRLQAPALFTLPSFRWNALLTTSHTKSGVIGIGQWNGARDGRALRRLRLRGGITSCSLSERLCGPVSCILSKPLDGVTSFFLVLQVSRITSCKGRHRRLTQDFLCWYAPHLLTECKRERSSHRVCQFFWQLYYLQMIN